MKNLIWIETDCPYFPGKNGHSFFLLQKLTKESKVAVIAPTYPNQPRESIFNLKRIVPNSLLWPEESFSTNKDNSPYDIKWELRKTLLIVPRKAKELILFRLLGLPVVDHAEYTRLAIFSNLAPYVWTALRRGFSEAIVMIQSDIAAWMDWLPRHLIKVVYVHDVRTDYLPQKLFYTKKDPKHVLTEMCSAMKQERKIAEAADHIAFVSDLDRLRFERLFPLSKERTSVVPIPVDEHYFIAKKTTPISNDPFEILFTGHLSHPPNVDALHFFLSEIWGPLQKSGGRFRLTVAGCSPCRSLVKRLHEVPEANFYPNIPDVRELFEKADVYIVPMRFGGGVRQKILEAMLMELPVVSTEMGLEGINLDADISTVHAVRNASEFTKKIFELRNQRHKASDLRIARNFVIKNYSPEQAGVALSKSIQTAFASRKKSPFRVLFDLRWMKNGLAGGIEPLARSLMSEISRIDHRNKYRILGPEQTIQELAFCPGSQFSIIPSEFPLGRFLPLWASAGRSLIKNMGMHPVLTPEMLHGRYYRKLSFDLVHSIPSYIHPEFMGFPNILSFTDLQHLTYPQFFSGQEIEQRNRLYRESVNAAAKILCISDFTKNDLQSKWNVPAAKLETVHLSASTVVRLAHIQVDSAKVLARFGLKQPFLFYPARLWAHKNHAALLRSFQTVCSAWKRPIHLVVTAERESFVKNHGALIEQLKLTERVCCTGYVSELELAALYKEAAMLVFPSLFEGFGMPVLEAMHFGCPVACSNTTSLPEIADNAARYFNPESTPDMTKAILDILESNELRRHLVEMGNKRKMAFSWRKSAMKTLCCYHDVHENR